ncbi:MAG: hypothetical protein ACREML_13810, partial [Vulcanimicrobiaceae bacterium]
MRRTVAEHDTVIAIKEHQARRHGLDRFYETPMCLRGTPFAFNRCGDVAGNTSITEELAVRVETGLTARFDPTPAFGRYDRRDDITIRLVRLDGCEMILGLRIVRRRGE